MLARVGRWVVREPARPWAVLAAALLLCLAVYLLRLDPVVGLYTDDAWYVLLAKALASGQGFTLINAPVPGIPPFYPPGFPAILSLVFRLWPEFPANVVAFKLVSVAAMLASGLLVFRFFRIERAEPFPLALGLAVATVLCPAFVFLATSTVMSEPVFAFLQLAAIVLIERTARAEGVKRTAVWVVAGGLVVALAFLVRTMAIALVIAAFAYLLLRRRIGVAALFALVVAVCTVPWLLHARAHAPTVAQQQIMNDAIAYGYSTHFWLQIADYPAYGTAGIADLPARVLRVARYIAGSDIGAMSVYPWYRSIEPAEWMLEGGAPAAFAYVLTAITILGFVRVLRRGLTVAELVVVATVGITLLWPFAPTRFVLPLLPFLLFYLASGLAWIADWIARASGRQASSRGDTPHDHASGRLVAAAYVWLVAAIGLYGNARVIEQLHGPADARPKWVKQFDDKLEALAWIRDSLPPDARIAAQNPALVHLFTGRTTVGTWDANTDLQQWRRAGARVCFDCWMDESHGFKAIHRSPSGEVLVLDLGR